MKLNRSLTTAAFALCVSASSLVADSISPTTFSTTLGVGESTTINKTVTVNAGTPTSSLVDVYFLADTTGSMGGEIGAVQAAAASILSSAAGLGNVAFAVGEYKDQPATSGDPFAYRLNTNITTNTAAVTAGLNMWGASGGNDIPEANLFGLQQAANTTAWRAGSARILVWFGDAVGHDPSGGATLATATAALVANHVEVEAIDVGNLNGTGQAASIAAATGGSLTSGINTATIVAAINAAINNAFTTYTSVGLDLSDAPAGVTVGSSPAITGSFDRSIARTFNFTVTFTGGAPGTYDFPIYGTVDGGRVATESDHIVVTGGTSVPDSGSALMLLGLAMVGVEAFRRKFASSVA